jgi:CRP-like cAMP-binding protein
MDNKVINSLPIFKSFSPDQVKLIEPLMEFCSFPADMVIFQQGDQAEYFYILTSGEIALHFKPYDGPSLVITKISSGGVFGWSAALNRAAYNAAAVTIKEITAIRMEAIKLNLINQGMNLNGDCGRRMDLDGNKSRIYA